LTLIKNIGILIYQIKESINMRKLTKKEEAIYVPFTPEQIKDIINKNDDQLSKALLKLYEYQTADEQKSEYTFEVNNVGFNSVDSNILTSFAKQLERKKLLSTKQLTVARKKLNKYCFQLAKIANNEYNNKIKLITNRTGL
jgi:RNA-binding protein YhbY